MPLMGKQESSHTRDGFCIYVDTFFKGEVPVVSDGEGKYVVFETELEAQREIADHAIVRLRQFLDGERDFDDAIIVEEWVVSVTVCPVGSVTDEAENKFGPSVE